METKNKSLPPLSHAPCPSFLQMKRKNVDPSSNRRSRRRRPGALNLMAPMTSSIHSRSTEGPNGTDDLFIYQLNRAELKLKKNNNKG